MLGFGRDVVCDSGQFTPCTLFASHMFSTQAVKCLDKAGSYSGYQRVLHYFTTTGSLKWVFGHPEGHKAPTQTAHKAGWHCPPTSNPIASCSLQLKSRRAPCFQARFTRIPKLPWFNDLQFSFSVHYYLNMGLLYLHILSRKSSVRSCWQL